MVRGFVGCAFPVRAKDDHEMTICPERTGTGNTFHEKVTVRLTGNLVGAVLRV